MRYIPEEVEHHQVVVEAVEERHQVERRRIAETELQVQEGHQDHQLRPLVQEERP